MRKRTFIANLVVWGVALVVCGAASIWTALYGSDTVDVFSSSMALLALITYSGPVAAFAAGALVGTIVVWVRKVHVAYVPRIVFRIAGVVPFALFAVSPLLIPVAPDAITLLLTIVLVLALEFPWAFVFVGLLYGLGLAPLHPEVVEELELRRAEKAAAREVHDSIAESNGTKKKRPHKKGSQKARR